MQTEPNELDLVTQWATQTERRRKKQRRVQNEEERSNNETQVPILTKPRRQKLQAMQNAKIGRVSPPWRCKNPATQAAKASSDAKRRDRTCLATATMQKPSNPGDESFRRCKTQRSNVSRRRNDAKTQRPRRRSDQTQAAKASGDA